MVHRLKIRQEFFVRVLARVKLAELRRNDRDFKVGDKLVFDEVDDTGVYTGRHCMVDVLYIMHDWHYGLEEGYVVMSIGNVRDIIFGSE